MDYSRQLREAEERIKRELRQEFANMIQVTTVSRSTATGNEDGAEGWPEAGESYERKPRRVQHFGFRSVPPKGDGEIMLLVGGGGAAEVTIGEYGENFGPTNLAEGDAALYSTQTGTIIVVRASGKIEITASNSQDVVVNGGTAKVARVGDHTAGHTHTATFTGTANLTTGAVTGTVTIASATDTINEGAAHFKG